MSGPRTGKKVREGRLGRLRLRARLTDTLREGDKDVGMAGNQTLGLIEESAVKELANIGLGHAITSLSTVTGRSFNMTVPSVQAVGMNTLVDLTGDPDMVTVGIYMPVDGDVQGHMAFLFPWESAVNLWTMVLGEAPANPMEISELAASAIIEIGNIINGSFLNAISDMCDLKLHATPPLVSVDAWASITASITAEAELGDVVALAVETEIFESNSNNTKGYFLCIPSVNGLNLLFQRLGIAEAA